MALVRSIMTHPRVYPWISDDASPAREEFTPIDHDALWYVLVWDSGELLGLFLFHPHSGACMEVHTCLLPVAYGKAAIAARECAVWMWGQAAIARIVTRVPAYNRLALRLARQAGMTEWGRNPRAWRKNEFLYDEIWLGLSKE